MPRAGAPSRPQASRTNSSRSHTPGVTTREDLFAAEGPISVENVQQLHEFVHPHHNQERTLVEGEDEDDKSIDEEEEARKLLPWWRRPSPWWLIAMMPLSSMAMAATIAPRVEVYTMLACQTHKPEIFYPSNTTGLMLADGKDRQACFKDPAVNAAVSQLATAMATSMGVLGCLTTGWWGSFSDRRGRIRALGISVIGLLMTDVIFIIVYYNVERLPGGYWFLLIGPLLEGSLGGMTSAIAAIHAYIADTSTPATRSGVLAMSMGIMFIGVALGPTLGGLLIHFTGQVISVFFAATLFHVGYACTIWFVVPESLTAKKMRLAAQRYRERASATGIKRWFPFLTPLSVVLPAVPNASTTPFKAAKRDWNLFLVATVYTLVVSIMGSYSVKFQYASFMFGWTSETISYWLSLLGATRALYLAVILPLFIKFFKSKPKTHPVRRASPEEEPLMHPSSSNSSRSSSRSDSPSRLQEPHSSHFDLRLAQVSLGFELVSYTLMALTTSPGMFTLFAMIASFGGGFPPAIQSVALDLYSRKGEIETGKLFGAISVLQALSSQIVGPAMYGVIYMNTVATFPRAVFFVSVATVAISFVILAFVRIPKSQEREDSTEEEEQLLSLLPPSPVGGERTLVNVDDLQNRKKTRQPLPADMD